MTGPKSKTKDSIITLVTDNVTTFSPPLLDLYMSKQRSSHNLQMLQSNV
jgi:hypothetical protein